MGRTPFVPAALCTGPFTVEEARRAGLARWHLEGASWKRLGWGSYIWAGLTENTLSRLTAAMQRLPDSAVFSGLTAAWLHGIDTVPCDPIEVTVPVDAGVYSRSGIRIYRANLMATEIALLRGMPATAVVRTVADVSGRLSLVEAVVVTDAALHLRRLRTEQLADWVKSRRGRGSGRLRRVIDLAEPASESPMETRLRMVLVLGGLPKPKVQVSIHDREGRLVGRPDLYYEEARLGIEYDGAIHRTSLVEDNRRQNKLLNAGVRLLRFTASDVMNNPQSLVTQVRALLNTQHGYDSS